MEKEMFVPFKNDKGQIIDPEIAKKMAYDQKDMLEEDRITIEGSDDMVEDCGETYHAEKMTPIVVEKIKNALSEDELKVIREMLEHPHNKYAEKFKSLLYEGLPEEE